MVGGMHSEPSDELHDAIEALVDSSVPFGSKPHTVWGDESDEVSAVLDWAVHRIWRGTDPMTSAKPAAELDELLGDTITATGLGAARALELFADVIVPATRSQDDPMNLAYIPSAPTRAAAAFELATSASNIFAGLWEAGAGAIHAENQVIGWLAGLLGWDDKAGGCFVAGGTIGNLSALVAARHHAEAKRVAKGLDPHPPQRWAVVCTEDAHSSIKSAARVIGVEVILVPGDGRGRLTGEALNATLDNYGDRVCAVVCTAGTTNAGVVDDFATVGPVCRFHDVWLHVDGAYGGAALVAPSVADRFTGIRFADSFIVDPHKWLFAPYDACALVYRRPELAKAAHQQTASYLDHVDRHEWNPADLAVHLSRRPRGLPLWFSLTTHGTDRYRTAVEKCLATAREVADAIRDREGLRLLVPPELSVLIFDRPGWTEADYAAWSRSQAKAGRILCVPTRWQGQPVLRLAFVNPQTDAAQVIAALETLFT